MKILNQKASQKIESLTWDEINSILPCEGGSSGGGGGSTCESGPYIPPTNPPPIWKLSF